MFEILERYHHHGDFEFGKLENLAEKCNAPRNKSGIYIVFNEKNTLIYIGRSGHKLCDGTIKHRQDGIYGRLVDGKQFGKARRNSWPLKMKERGDERLLVFWYDTENDNPKAVESILLHEVVKEFGSLPPWNGQLPRDDYEL